MTEADYQILLDSKIREVIELKAEAAIAQLRVFKLEDALRFYAHPGRWKMVFTGEKTDPKFTWEPLPATVGDHGEIARQALTGQAPALWNRGGEITKVTMPEGPPKSGAPGSADYYGWQNPGREEKK